MKKKLKILAIGVCLLILNSCDSEDSIRLQTKSINKIISLGASRVTGNSPLHESFRYELWKDLTENNWTFDFIGTQTDKASYPTFNNLSFDKNHEGRASWTSKQILNDMNNWLSKTGPPDIVLFSSPGGNDALQNLPYDQIISNIYEIVDVLQNANPNVSIIIEQTAPAKSKHMTGHLKWYADQMEIDLLTIASNSSTSSSKVIAIDMYTGFTDSLLADAVHYNEAGADFIASRYYKVLQNILE